MTNPRMTVKERNLLKGAIRRVFSRSELHGQIIKKSAIQHSDPCRPRVKNWCKCNVCGKPEARSYVVIDHLDPVVPTDSALEFMSWNELVDRIWCNETNLQAICPVCHKIKSKLEMRVRKENKKKAKQLLANDTGNVYAHKTKE